MASERAAHDAPSRDSLLVQRLLQTGLACAAVLMAAGLVVQLASGARISMPVRMVELTYASIPIGERLMGIGILVLAFTPVLRVVMLAGLWIRERDWRFVLVALSVVLTLGLAIAAGRG